MQDRQQDHPGDIKRNLNQFIGLAQCFAYLLEVWLRVPGTAGSRYWSGHAFIGWCFLLVIASFGNSLPLMDFWLATGAAFVFQKMRHSVRKAKGYCPHSRFVGISLLSGLGGNRIAIQLWEPLTAFIVGLELVKSGYGYGQLFMVLAVCLFVSAAYALAGERVQITAVTDARADQAWLSEYVRKGR